MYVEPSTRVKYPQFSKSGEEQDVSITRHYHSHLYTHIIYVLCSRFDYMPARKWSISHQSQVGSYISPRIQSNLLSLRTIPEGHSGNRANLFFLCRIEQKHYFNGQAICSRLSLLQDSVCRMRQLY